VPLLSWRVFYLMITTQKPLTACEISVSLSGRESEKLRFYAEVEALEPGTSTLRLFCPVCCPRGHSGLELFTLPKSSSWGTYVLEQTEVMMSKLHLHWTHQTTPRSSNKVSRTNHVTPTLIRLVKDTHALDVRLRRPRSGMSGDVITVLF
jgi:trafficking protein particle complex subunit 10